MSKSLLMEGEKTLLRTQSCYSLTCITWKPGFLCLTDKRLVFSQPNKTILGINFNEIIDVTLMKGRFILGLRKIHLCILHKRPTGEKIFRAFFAVNDPNKWKEAIANARATYLNAEASKPMIDVFDEKNHLRVVAEMSNLRNLADVELRAINDTLAIQVDTDNWKYCEVVKLPALVKAGKFTSTYKNGVLEIRLDKLSE